MCINQRNVFNPYSQSSFFVKCGKCKSCLQEKAYGRSYRIKMETSPYTIALFVTLTYDRNSCPFVLLSDVEQRKDVLPIYREHKTRRVRCSTSHGLRYLDKRVLELQHLDDICFPNYDSFDYNHGGKLRPLAYRPDHIGVCYYPDIQNFKKRLSQDLKRVFNYDKPYKIYSCSEYGETTSRPHFHLLVFIQPSDEATFRTAICQAWPFASKFRTSRYIEIARDCANYVSSYVNSGTSLCGFLSDNFAPKHSYSKDFGMGNKLFSLDSILQKVRERNLSYLRGVGKKGMETYVRVPIPKYVINRYFPLFKGYSRFTFSEVYDVLRSFTGYRRNVHTPLISLDKLLSIDYSSDDLMKIGVRLSNAFEKYCRLLNLDRTLSARESFISDYVEAWRVYKSTSLRLWYEDDSVSWKYKFDNIGSLALLNAEPTRLFLLGTDGKWIDNPNEFPHVVERTLLYESIYDFRCKERKVNNYVMSQNNYFF